MNALNQVPVARMAMESQLLLSSILTTSLSSFHSQDFLKYSKKASLDTSELEVLCGPATLPKSPTSLGSGPGRGCTRGGGGGPMGYLMPSLPWSLWRCSGGLAPSSLEEHDL